MARAREILQGYGDMTRRYEAQFKGLEKEVSEAQNRLRIEKEAAEPELKNAFSEIAHEMVEYLRPHPVWCLLWQDDENNWNVVHDITFDKAHEIIQANDNWVDFMVTLKFDRFKTAL